MLSPSRLRLFRLSLSLTVLGLASLSQTMAQTPQQVELGISPGGIQPVNGKLPASTTVVVFAKNCEATTANLAEGTLRFSGSLLLTSVSKGKCFISGTLNLDPTTPPGNYKVLLLDGSNNVIGGTDLGVLDVTAGPIPPGIAPQVDVMWQVVSQSVCYDVFGRRVSDYFYCIEIKIGNNSGHPLQIAGIGFSKHVEMLLGAPNIIEANTSYATTRAVLLHGSNVSTRNTIYHSLQAGGLIMAASIPYFSRPKASKNYATASSIVNGALLAGFDLVWPDRSIVHLNNLDDESFRDNMVIPNNTHARTMVFVEKRALTEILESMCENDDVDETPANEKAKATRKRGTPTSSSSAQGAIAPDPTARAREENSVGSLASQDSGAPDTHGLEKSVPKGDQGCLLGDAEGTRGLDRDSKKRKMIALASSKSAENSEQKHKNRFLHFLGKGISDHSPLLVKLALGSLVIVGDEIEYIQRVQVQSPATPSQTNVKLAPENIVFGNQEVASSSASQTITLTNSGSAALAGLLVKITGTNQNDFTETDTCGTSLAPSANCAISVKFTPTAPGPRAGTLNVAFTGSGAGISASLGGSGTQSVTFSAETINFPPQAVKTPSGVLATTLSNAAATPLTGVSVKIYGTDASNFKSTDTCTNASVVNAGASCVFSVTFTPTDAGTRSATLTVSYTLNGTQIDRKISLSGTGKN